MADDDLLVRIGLTEKQYLQALARMEKQSVGAAKKAEDAFKKSNRTVARGAANLNRAAAGSSNSLRMMSMQLSQVAQQGAATGNYLKALAIQLPDLALGLGTAGILAGALAPILITLGQEFLFSGEQAEDFAEKLKKVKEAQDALNSDLRQLRLGVSAEELTLLDAIASSRQKIAEIEEKLQGDRVRGVSALRDDIKAEQQVVVELQEQLQTIRRLQAEQATFKARTAETADAERMLGEQMQSTGQELAENERIAKLLRDGINASVIAGMQLAGIDMAAPINAAAMEAARLASNLGIAFEAASGLLNQRGGRGQDPRRFGGRAIDINTAEAGEFLANYKEPKSGGSGEDTVKADLERLQETLMSEEALQIASFARQQELLEEALEKRRITQEEYNTLSEASQQQHAGRMAHISVYRHGTTLQKTEAFLGQMATAFAQGNDKMQRAAEAFAAVETVINAYRAHNQTLADPKLPFFAKIPAAATILAAGLNAASAIKGAGSSGGGGAVASASAPQAATTQVERTVTVDVRGSTIPREFVNELISAINEAVGDGATIRT